MSQLQLNTTSPLLLNLLNRVVNVDFRSLAKLDMETNKKSLRQKELIVCVIDELIRIAENNNWGLCKMGAFIYVYTGEYWEKVEPEDFKAFLGDAAWLMGLRRTDAKYYEFQEKLFLQFMASAKLTTERREDETTIINLRNGTFETGPQGIKLREFNRKDALTYQLSFPYDKEAKCPLFIEYLNRVLPDESLRHILAEYIGYVFAKSLKLEKCLLLYGSGANGKSVFFEIMNALLGDKNISNFTLGNLAEENNRAFLDNMLLNYGSEIKGSVDADLFKQLVSGEPVQCRFKYKDSFTIRNYARLCFNCNELPREVEHTDAYFRRFLIIPFEVTIPEEEQNPDLAKEIISRELSGIFNWVLDGLQRVLEKKRFTESVKTIKALKEYKEQSDSVFLFLQECGYKKSSEVNTLVKFIFPLYKSFCQDNGLIHVSTPKFNRRLVNFGYTIARKNKGMVVNLVQEDMQQNY
jgi:putative DNA primase/helicase